MNAKVLPFRPARDLDVTELIRAMLNRQQLTKDRRPPRQPMPVLGADGVVMFEIEDLDEFDR